MRTRQKSKWDGNVKELSTVFEAVALYSIFRRGFTLIATVLSPGICSFDLL